MSDTKSTDDKTLGVNKKTLTLKRPGVEQSTVRQNFSHGRTKSVVVETKKRKFSLPDQKPEVTPPAAPAPAAPAPASAAPAPSAPVVRPAAPQPAPAPVQATTSSAAPAPAPRPAAPAPSTSAASASASARPAAPAHSQRPAQQPRWSWQGTQISRLCYGKRATRFRPSTRSWTASSSTSCPRTSPHRS